MDGMGRFPKAPAAGPRLGGSPAITSGTGYPWVDGDVLYAADLNAAFALGAPLASPVFTGDPQAPTATAGDNDTSIATTAFVQAAVQAAVAPVQASAQNNVGRNLLHNPLFNVAQRGVGPFTTSVYTLDRWVTAFSSDTFSFAQQALADVHRTQLGDEEAAVCLANTFTGNAAAGAYHYITQKIENVRRLAGKTVTVSFWALAGSGTPKLGVSIYQGFGTGGSPSAQVTVPGQAVTLGNSFATRYTVTFAVPSISGKTLGTNNDSSTWLNFWYSCGTTNATLSGSVGVQSGTFWLWGVQLEIGSVATPLEKRDPRYDLSNCQRFYQTIQVYNSMYQQAGGGFTATSSFPVTMRAVPTIVVNSNTSSNVGALASGPLVGGGGAWATAAATATGSALVSAILSASADL